MVKKKVTNESKEDKFKRIASHRTEKILNAIRILGNCSNRTTYSYTEEQVNKIFDTIIKEINKTKRRFIFKKEKRKFRL